MNCVPSGNVVDEDGHVDLWCVQGWGCVEESGEDVPCNDAEAWRVDGWCVEEDWCVDGLRGLWQYLDESGDFETVPMTFVASMEMMLSDAMVLLAMSSPWMVPLTMWLEVTELLASSEPVTASVSICADPTELEAILIFVTAPSTMAVVPTELS